LGAAKSEGTEMICSIVLAAGMSRRMGVQKLLLPFAGQTVISRIVAELLGSIVNEIHVVVGHDADKITGELSGRNVSIAVNPDYEKGMLSSVRCGIRALPEQCESVLIALGDQPGITSKLVDEMAGAFAATEKGILVPLYDGKRGHPLMFSRGYCDEILKCYDDVGLRGLAPAHPEDVFELNVSSAAVLSDMDYPEDYRREVELLGEGPSPSCA